MNSITQYLITVITTALIGTIGVGFIGEKGIHGRLIKLISGVLLTLIVVSPLTGFDISSIDNFAEEITFEADMYVNQGVDMASTEERAFIKSKLESYILDKAALYNIDLVADVTLNESNPPLPRSVQLTGTVSPYAKMHLKHFITEELDIPEENQLWN